MGVSFVLLAREGTARWMYRGGRYNRCVERQSVSEVEVRTDRPAWMTTMKGRT